MVILFVLPYPGRPGGVSASEKSQTHAAFHPHRILLKPRSQSNLTLNHLSGLHSLNGARIIHKFSAMEDLQVLELPESADVKTLVEKYRRDASVAYAEPDYERHVLVEPNDRMYVDGTLWGLNNIGQNGGTYNADIDAPEGWEIRREATIIVAVIDSGIRGTHEDLAANLWRNPGEIPGNGLDDDGDGYVDDVNGINAITRSGDPNDDHGHGTHVAGIIGAVGNNGVGCVGVAWRVQLMACKFINASGTGYDSDAIACIDYARTHGASVINASWGGGSFSQALQDAIRAAGQAGIVFVAAAGNSSADTDVSPFYPASYQLDNSIVVAATSQNDDLAYFSNFGQGTVSVGAPGLDITSTWNTSDSAYQNLSGTSMAAPHVSGVFALLKSQFPQESYLQLINRLYSSIDPLSALRGKCRTGGRINLSKALRSISSRPGNDDFSNRMELFGQQLQAKGINFDATKEAGEPNHAGNLGGKSIWWKWRPSSAGVASINASGNGFNPLLAVYTGSNVSSLSFVASSDGYVSPNTTSNVAFAVEAGTDYAIAVDGRDGTAGVISLNLMLRPRPVNDNFKDRIAISGTESTVTSSNSLATAEPGEPIHAGQGGGKSVWWSWAPVLSGPATISTEGSDFNTILAIYVGSSVSNLTLVASNDDDPRGGTTTSRIEFSAVAGTTYQIAVDGYHGATGHISLNTPPTNDNFANRASLLDSSASGVGFNLLATKETFEPAHAGNPGGKSLWWSWTAPFSGIATFTTIGSTFDTVVGVYTGESLGNLSLIAANDNDAYGNFTSLASFNAVAGTTYQIAVDGANGASGMVRLQIIMGSEYVITDIGSPLDGSDARSINNHGVAAGSYMTSAPEYTHHACIWSADTGIQSLMTGDTESQANDINDFNQVVGYLTRPGYGSIPFIWQNGVVRELGGLDSHPFGGAYSIDNAGRVVGWSAKGNLIHAFLWQDGVMTDLGAVGSDRTAAYGLNGPNYVIGSGSHYDASGQWPLLWHDGKIVTLPLPQADVQGCALAVNALSQVIGHYQGSSVLHGLLWEEEVAIDLGPGPAGYSEAVAINNLGQIVGDDQDNALLYQSGRWRYLSDLVPAGSGWSSLFFALDINDRGQIAGAGIRNGRTRGFVMTPLTPVTPRAIIISPTNHQSFSASTDISINFWLVPDSANVAKLECFEGSRLIGTTSNSPYTIIWTNVPAGEYVLSALLTSSAGAKEISKSVSISVLSPPILNVSRTSQALTLSWLETTPLVFQLETATSLNPPTLWSPVTNPVSINGGSNGISLSITNDMQFFRLLRTK